MQYLEDLTLNFLCLYLSRPAHVHLPDNSISRSNGFSQKLNIIYKKTPLSLKLEHDHYSAILWKKPYEVIPSLIEDAVSNEETYLTKERYEEILDFLQFTNQIKIQVGENLPNML